MKKIVLVIFLCTSFVAGCGGGPYDPDGYNKWGYNRDGYHRDGHALFGPRDPNKPHKTKRTFVQIMAEKKQAFVQEEVALIREKYNLHRKYETLDAKHAVFLTILNDEELQAYEKFISSGQSNLAVRELYSRALDKTLTEENAQLFATLRQKYANLETERITLTQKIQSYNNRVAKHNQLLQRGIETIKQSSDQQAKGHPRQSQQYWQNYYNQQYQQQLPNSLNNIQTSIMNPDSGATVVPAPR